MISSFTSSFSYGRVRYHILGSYTYSSQLRSAIPVLLLTLYFSHRYHLIYHSARQVLWGTAIGVICGISYYAMVEYVPSRFPSSHLGRIRTALLVHPISIWLRLRDGWSVYPDGGTEDQWQAWKNRWDTQRSIEKKIQ